MSTYEQMLQANMANITALTRYAPNAVTATQLKQQDLKRATLEKEAQLGSLQEKDQEWADIQRSQYTPEYLIQEELRKRQAMRNRPMEERMADINDTEAQQALHNNSLSYNTMYGLNDFNQQALANTVERSKLAEDASITHSDPNVGTGALNTARNVAVGAGKGVLQTAGVVESLGRMGYSALKGEDAQAKAERLDNNYMNNMSDWATNNLQSANHATALTRENRMSTLQDNRAERDTRANAYALGEEGSKDYANSITRSNNMHQALTSTEWIENGIGELLPDLALSVATMGVGYAAGKKLTETAVRKGVEKAIKQKIASKAVGSKVTSFTQKQVDEIADRYMESFGKKAYEATASKVGSATGTALSSAQSAVEEAIPNGIQAFTDVMNQDPNQLMQTDVAKQMLAENPNLTPAQIQEEMANEAMGNALFQTGASSLLVNAVLGNSLEKGLAGIGKSKGILGNIGKGITDVAKEAPSEYLEEFASDAIPKVVVNEATGMDIYRDPYATANVSGMKGAVLGTVVGAGAVAPTGVARTAGAVYNAGVKGVNLGNKKLKSQVIDKEVKADVPVIESVFGTSAGTDKDGNEIPAQKGILNTTFEESGFSQAWKNIEGIINPINEDGSKKTGDDLSAFSNLSKNSNNYTQTLYKMHSMYTDSLKKVTLAKHGKLNLSEKAQEKHLKVIEEFDVIRNVLTDTVNVELEKFGNQEITQELTNELKVLNSMEQNTEEFNTQANKVVELQQKLSQSIGQSQQVQKFKETKLFKILNPQESIKAEIDIADSTNEKGNLGVDTADVGGNLDDITIYNSVKKLQNDLKQTDEAGNPIKGFTETLTELNGLTDQLSTAVRQSTNTKHTTLKNIQEFAKSYTDITNGLGKTATSKMTDTARVMGLIANQDLSKLSEEESKSLLEKYVGSAEGDKSMIGLMQYARIKDKGNGKLSVKQQNNLTKFIQSQEGKEIGIQQMITDMRDFAKNKGLSESQNLGQVFQYTNPYSNNGEPQGTFTNVIQAKKYAKILERESELFREVAENILGKKVSPLPNNPNVKVVEPTESTDSNENEDDNNKVEEVEETKKTETETAESEETGENTSKDDDEAKESNNEQDSNDSSNSNDSNSNDTGNSSSNSDSNNDTKGNKNSKGKSSEPVEPTILTPETLPELPNTINIFAGTNENAELSNFAKRPFTYENKKFVSVEQAFQFYKAMEAGNTEVAEKIMTTTNPVEMKKLTNRYNLSFTPDKLEGWELKSYGLMKELIKASFIQNPDAKQLLLNTGKTKLTHNQDNTKWKKDFPKILMEVRKELKNNSEEVINIALEDTKAKELAKILENNHKENIPTILASLVQLEPKNREEMSDDFGKPFDKYPNPELVKSYFIPKDKIKGSISDSDLKRAEGWVVPTKEGNTDGYLVNVPVSLNKQLYDRGISIESSQLMEAGSFSSKKANESLSEDTLLNPTLENINKDLKEDNKLEEVNDTDIKFINAVAFIENTFKQRMVQGGAYPLFLRSIDKVPSKLSNISNNIAFNTVNALNQFMNVGIVDGNVQVNMPTEVIKGLTNSVIKTVTESTKMNIINNDNLEEYLRNDKQAVEIKVFNTSRSQITNNSERTAMDGKTHGMKAFNETQPYGEHYYSRALKEVGIPKADMQEKLGKHFLDSIGFKFNKDTPSNVRDAQIYGIGVEIYDHLLEAGYLQEFRVEHRNSTDDKTKPTKMYYANFTWNVNSVLPRNVRDAMFTLKHSNTAVIPEELTRARNIVDNYGANNPAILPYLDLIESMDSNIAKSLFADSRDENRGLKVGTQALILSGEMKPFNATKQNVAKKINTGENTQIIDALQTHNETVYTYNTNLTDIIDVAPELVKRGFGVFPEERITSAVITESTKSAEMSKLEQSTRSWNSIVDMMESTRESGVDLKDSAFYIKHKQSSNGRIMNEGVLAPQGSKSHREIFVATNGIKDKEGNITKYENPSMKINYSDKPRDMLNVFRSVEKDLSKPSVKGVERLKTTLGFTLAVAQSFGVKIEKSNTNTVIKELTEILNEPMIQDLVDLMWKLDVAKQNRESYMHSNEELKLMDDAYDRWGTDTPWALNSIVSLAKYKYGNTGDYGIRGTTAEFTPNIYIEGDGVANGMYNILRQFTTGLTATYLQNLKRTGTLSLDVLVGMFADQLQNSKGKPTDEAIWNARQGLDYMYDQESASAEGEKALDDVYEVIAEKLSWDVGKAIDTIKEFTKAQNITNESLLNVATKAWNYPDKDDKKEQKFVKAVQLINQINMLDFIDLPDINSNDLDLLLYRIEELNMSDGSIQAHIKRNLAKAGTTPSVYGGGVSGITEQVISDMYTNIYKKIDKLGSVITSKATPEEKKNEFLRTAGIINNFLVTHGIQSPLATGNGNLSSEVLKLGEKILTNNKYLKQDIGALILKTEKAVITKRTTIKRKVKNALATTLNDSIQFTFAEAFGALKHSMALDSSKYIEFMDEFEQAVNTRMAQRNKANGYELNDPRNQDMLSKDEMKDVFRNMKNLPLVATAFSNDEYLLDELLNVGTSVIKEERVEGSRNFKVKSSFSVASRMSSQGGQYNAVDKSNLDKEERIGGLNGVVLTHMQSVIYPKIMEYKPAGASNATSSIPTTESKTMALANKELQDYKNGLISIQNVFDGILGQFFDRETISEIINRATDDVHNNTFIMRGYLEAMDRSGIKDTIANSRSFKDMLNEFSSKNLVTLNYKDVKGLLHLNSLAIQKMEAKKLKLGDKNELSYEEFDEIQRKISILRNNQTKLFDKLEDTRKENYVETSRDLISIEFDNRDSSTDEINKINLHILAKVMDTGGNNSQEAFYNEVMIDYVHMAATNYAVKQVEKDVLPAIISQFAGSGKGYFKDKEAFFKQSGIAERYIEFLTNKNINISNSDYRHNSYLLQEFIEQDSEIQKVYQKAFAEERNSITVNLFDADDSKKLVEENSNITIAELINEFNFGNFSNSIFGKTLNIVSHLANVFAKDYLNKPIITNREEFINKIIDDNPQNFKDEASKEEFRLKHLSVEVNGSFHPSAGIYVNPEALESSIGMQTIAHELVHSINRTIFNDFYMNGGNNLSKNSLGAVMNLQSIAMQYAKLILNSKDNQEVVKLLEEVQNDPEMNLDLTYSKATSPVTASAVNLLYAFDTLPKSLDMELVHNKELVASKQREAIEEFTANALSNYDMLNRLYYKKDKNTKLSKLAKSPAFKYLIDTFTKAKNAVLTMWGMDTKKEMNTDSMLFNILASYQTITGDKKFLEATGRTEKRSKSTKVFNSVVNGSKSSNSHKDYLKDLYSTYKKTVRTILPKDRYGRVNAELIGYPDEITILTQKENKRENQEVMNELKTIGLSFTPTESVMFNNIVNLSRANTSLDNKQFIDNTNTFVNAVLNNEQESPLVAEVLRKLNQSHQKNTKQNLVHIINALALTNEQFRNELDNLSYTATGTDTKLSKAVNRFKVALNVPFEKSLSNLKDASTNLIKADLMNLDTSNKLSMAEMDTIERARKKKSDAQFKIANKLGELTDSDKVQGLVSSLTGSKQLEDDYSDYDTALGNGLRETMMLLEDKAGRPTLTSNIVRWAVGATSKTAYIYKHLGKKQATAEQVRERIGNAIPVGIRSIFKEPLTNEQEDSISEVLNPTMLHRLLEIDKVTNNELIGILEKDTKRKLAIDKELTVLRRKVANLGLSDKNQDKVYNFLKWQIEGLGDSSVNYSAKSDGYNSNNILPNARVISTLPMIRNLLVGDTLGKPEDVSKELLPAIKSLVTLHALGNTSMESKQELAELAKSDWEGFRYLLDSSSLIESSSNKRFKNNLMGADGYEKYFKDPMVDTVAVHPKDVNKIQILESQGYDYVETLPNGYEVYNTKMKLGNRYKTGLFSFAENTVGGVSVTTGKVLGLNEINDFSGLTDIVLEREFMSQATRAMNTSSYYSNLINESSSKPVINALGQIERTDVAVPKHILREYEMSSEHGIDAIGNYHARLVEEATTEQDNKQYIDILNRKYASLSEAEKAGHIKIDGNAKPVGNKPEDIRYANALNDFYEKLPLKTKEYIKNTRDGGIWVNRSELNNIVGYSQASITDIWEGTSGLPKEVQYIIKGMFSILSPLGFNPVKSARYLETGVKEVVHFNKDVILNRSLIVPISNFISNAVHISAQLGLNPKTAVKDMKEGYLLAKEYQKYSNRLVEIEYQLLHSTLEPKQRDKLLAEKTIVNNKLENNPVHPMVQEGILTSITAQDIGVETDEYSLASKFRNKIGINKATNILPKELVSGFNNVMLNEGSKTHTFMVNAMDYGDFIAKYAVYKDLTKRQNRNKQYAMDIIRDEFVNYGMNRGRVFDWINATGISYYLAYSVGIQKIIFRNFRKSPIRTLATMAGDTGIHSVWDDEYELLKTVPMNHWLPFNDRDDVLHNFRKTGFIPSSDAHYLSSIFGLF